MTRSRLLLRLRIQRQTRPDRRPLHLRDRTTSIGHVPGGSGRSVRARYCVRVELLVCQVSPAFSCRIDDMVRSVDCAIDRLRLLLTQFGARPTRRLPSRSGAHRRCRDVDAVADPARHLLLMSLDGWLRIGESIPRRALPLTLLRDAVRCVDAKELRSDTHVSLPLRRQLFAQPRLQASWRACIRHLSHTCLVRALLASRLRAASAGEGTSLAFNFQF